MRPCVLGILGVCLMLSACGEPVPSAQLRVYLKSATAQEAAEASRILLLRFGDFRASRRSEVSARIEGNQLHFEFRGPAPAASDLEYLARTQGILRVFLREAPNLIWYTDRDFVEMPQCRGAGENAYLDVRLSPAAAARMRDHTRRNQGRVVVTTWDGRPIMGSTIQGTFGEQFQSPIPLDENFQRFCAVVRHGRLPVAVENSQYQPLN